ncbi:hypothetical protein L6R50_00325 [Myxococcota bacterium]|nr:hypothetical protein [Myxococcota bacterium]
MFLITILPAARAEVVEGDLDPQGADLGGLTAAFVADEDSRLLPLVEIRAADTRTYEYWVQCRLVFFDLEYSWSEGPFTLSPAETAWVDVTPPWDALIHDAQTTRPSDVIATVLGVDVEADVIALRHRLPVVHASFDADGSLTAIQGDELASAWREDPSLPPELVEAAPPEGDPNVVGAVFDGGPSLDGVAGY